MQPGIWRLCATSLFEPRWRATHPLVQRTHDSFLCFSGEPRPQPAADVSLGSWDRTHSVKHPGLERMEVISLVLLSTLDSQ